MARMTPPLQALLPLLVITLTLSAVQEAQALLTGDLDPPVRVASFNVRGYGMTKASKPEVLANIAAILSRYDLVLVIETRDQSLASLDMLREELGEGEWDYVSSEPIGRTTYKEQYVFFYRPEVVTFVGDHKFKDTEDDFEREPYMAEFEYRSQFAGSEVKVTFIAAHLNPQSVVAEMQALPAAISEAQRVFPESGAYITMGDLNADCGYMSCKSREQTPLFSTPELYTNLVPDKLDTTVAATHCAYDRVIATVQERPSVKVADVQVYDFQAGLGLTYDQAWAVSDHYPVEFSLE